MLTTAPRMKLRTVLNVIGSVKQPAVRVVLQHLRERLVAGLWPLRQPGGRQGANETPSSEVKHAALPDAPPSASTVTTPVGSICSRPLVAVQRSTWANTTLTGRKPAGRVNGTGLVPEVAIAPLRWTMPEMVRTAGAEVPNGELNQPFCRVSGVNDVADFANETPSSEVKHAALLNAPPSAWAVTAPV